MTANFCKTTMLVVAVEGDKSPIPVSGRYPTGVNEFSIFVKVFECRIAHALRAFVRAISLYDFKATKPQI